MSEKILITADDFEQMFNKLKKLKEEAEEAPLLEFRNIVPLSSQTIQGLVKESRKAMGSTQEGISDLSNVGLSTVQKIERGELNVNLQSFQHVLEVLGIELCLRKR
jgi:ribosome-binding protein aMBF1 (putative translation factor)